VRDGPCSHPLLFVSWRSRTPLLNMGCVFDRLRSPWDWIPPAPMFFFLGATKRHSHVAILGSGKMDPWFFFFRVKTLGFFFRCTKPNVLTLQNANKILFSLFFPPLLFFVFLFFAKRKSSFRVFSSLVFRQKRFHAPGTPSCPQFDLRLL